MNIRYATAHCWRKEVTDDPLSVFGKSERKKLTETLRKIDGNNIRFSIAPLAEEFFDWWYPLYRKRISTKTNPIFLDIKAKTVGNSDKEKKYFSLTLFEGDDKLGGLIFSTKKDVLFFAYRALAYDWKKARLRASPSLYVEYIMAEHAREIGMKHISHGKDRNLYGVHSGIGLASFKLAAGCRPQLLSSFEIENLDTDNLTTDTLILECPKDASPHRDITRAHLVADAEGVEKWRSVLEYPKHLKVEVIERRNLL